MIISSPFYNFGGKYQLAQFACRVKQHSRQVNAIKGAAAENMSSFWKEWESAKAAISRIEQPSFPEFD